MKQDTLTENLIVVTDSAIIKIKELISKEPNADKLLLRFQAQPGGCSGYQYGLGFDDAATAEDQCFMIQGVNIAIDKQSLQHLKGTHLDYVDGLQGSGFKFTNPNAKSTCGCGKSFC
ncbi:MAG TPA: iron-sulfur cluster assembly accessory protein [Candidatus Nanoarchaeia archaeon]|nr:iron-sulfur cluster assembly accessory protein [Candidatus Nanoarchaeia archaeon]